MSALLRVHRGWASPDRVLMLANTELGPLTGDVNEFTVPAGDHLLSLKLGPYHSLTTSFKVGDGDTLELTVVENPDAILPLAQGGYLRLVGTPLADKGQQHHH